MDALFRGMLLSVGRKTTYLYLIIDQPECVMCADGFNKSSVLRTQDLIFTHFGSV